VTVIRGNLALLRRESVPEATRREAVLEADEEAARMGRLVTDLLLLARADAGELPSLDRAPVDLAELAREVVDRIRLSAERRFDVTTSGACTVLGDRERLRQLIANLVENAVRYTRAGGEISVQVVAGPAARLQQPAAGARFRSAGGPLLVDSAAVLTVSDNGIGISATDLPHVFERFYRADKARSRAGGGSGLGLSIAEYIAHAHGGSIEVSSGGQNRGSTFRVLLPLLEVEEKSSAAVSPRTRRRNASSARPPVKQPSL
jgi:two-component system OmpR family sensor kinase